jgi:hypothetical protein
MVYNKVVGSPAGLGDAHVANHAADGQAKPYWEVLLRELCWGHLHKIMAESLP